jgi:hypothetical protein
MYRAASAVGSPLGQPGHCGSIHSRYRPSASRWNQYGSTVALPRRASSGIAVRVAAGIPKNGTNACW